MNYRCPVCESESGVEVMAMDERQYIRCDHCDHITQFPYPTNDEISVYNSRQVALDLHRAMKKYTVYNNFMHINSDGSVSVDKQYQSNRKAILTRIKPYIELSNALNFLDIGFGAGGLIQAASNLGWNTYGVDTDPNAKRFVQQMVPEAHLELGYFPNEDDEFFEGVQFDFCTITHVLEHIVDPDLFLEALSQRMNVGGVLYVDIPNIYCSDSLDNIQKWHLTQFKIHVNHYSPISLQYMMAKHGMLLRYIHMGLRENDQMIQMYFTKDITPSKKFMSRKI